MNPLAASGTVTFPASAWMVVASTAEEAITPGRVGQPAFTARKQSEQ